MQTSGETINVTCVVHFIMQDGEVGNETEALSNYSLAEVLEYIYCQAENGLHVYSVRKDERFDDIEEGDLVSLKLEVLSSHSPSASHTRRPTYATSVLTLTALTIVATATLVVSHCRCLSLPLRALCLTTS